MSSLTTRRAVYPHHPVRRRHRRRRRHHYPVVRLRREPRQSAATYRRRRALVVLLVMLVVALAVALVGVLPTGAVSATDDQHIEVIEVTAFPGDSLWTMAREYRGAIEISDYVALLIDLNDGARIYAGQAVRVPVGEGVLRG